MIFPRIKLRTLLRRSQEAVEVMPDDVYKQVTVRLFHKGVVLRREMGGAEIRSTRQWRVRAGQVILSRIDARNGAIGIVPEELDGAIVTSDFWAFDVDAVADSRFLDAYFGTAEFVEACRLASEGTTNRVRLQPEAFLEIEVPLPPLPEQRRLATHLDTLSRKLHEARTLRHQAAEEAEAVLQSALAQCFRPGALERWGSEPLSELITIEARQVDPTLPEYSVLPHINGENIEKGTCRLLPYRTAEEDGVRSGNYLFENGAVLYSKIRPYLRKSAMVSFRGVCSADIYPIKVRSAELIPEFLMWGLVAPRFTEYAVERSGRTRMPKLNRDQLFGFTFFFPREKTRQSSIVRYLNVLRDKAADLKHEQAKTTAELEALMPSILAKVFQG